METMLTNDYVQVYLVRLVQATLIPGLKVAVTLLFLYWALVVLRLTIEAYWEVLDGAGHCG